MKVKFLNPLNISAKNLKKALITDVLRPAMQNVYVDIKRGRIVATNAHILACYGIDVVENEDCDKEGVLLPINFFDFNRYMVGFGPRNMFIQDLEYILTDDYAEVYLHGELAYRSKYIDQQYPDYNSVLPNKENIVPINGISLNPKLLSDLTSLMPVNSNGPRIEVEFYGKNKALIFRSEELSSKAGVPIETECFILLMPLQPKNEQY